MKFGKILVSIYQPGSAAILNSIPGLEVIEGLDTVDKDISLSSCLPMNCSIYDPKEFIVFHNRFYCN